MTASAAGKNPEEIWRVICYRGVTHDDEVLHTRWCRSRETCEHYVKWVVESQGEIVAVDRFLKADGSTIDAHPRAPIGPL